jgi:pimeloyl-ACP methyl ester carboxylesterase
MKPPKLIYLHGFASGPQSCKAQFFRARFAGLGIHLEVPALDGSDFENLTITGQLDVLAQVAGDESVTLIGSSMGGYLAALFAARHSNIEKLVLMAPAFGFARRWAERLGEESLKRWKETGLFSVFHYGQRADRNLGYGLIEDAFRYEDDPGFAQPALIFHGRNDETVPVSASIQFAAAHPNVRLDVLESGHELLDVLDAIWDETRRFVLA